MADIKLSKIAGGGGGLPQLAPDLNYPANKDNANNYYFITGIDASGGLTPVLSLSGKFEISNLALHDQTVESNTYKLTVDGVVIWNATRPGQGTPDLFIGGTLNSSSAATDAVISCETSFLFEVQTATDTSIALQYLARPIL